MFPAQDDWRHEMERDGFVILPGIFPPGEVEAIRRDLSAALQAPAAAGAALRHEAGPIYAARNLLLLWPAVATLWQRPPLPEALAAVLGPEYGLVRVLYFDKPPDETWALPWHKDLTIAVRGHRLPSCHFRKPTRKAGVPHVEAPETVLAQMLTARIHLDDVRDENGPLKVIPGSHHAGKALSNGEILPRTILAEQGDVLLMRPLVEHSSGRSHPNTRRHRRILHLEFAADRGLPDGYEWHTFLPGPAADGLSMAAFLPAPLEGVVRAVLPQPKEAPRKIEGAADR